MLDYENAIEVKDLTVRYDGFTLDHVSFDVAKGSIMGFIGQNGAGKTTTIKSILNIIKRDEGTIKLLGVDNLKDDLTVKEHVSVVFDEIPFHDQLSAKNLNIILKHIYRDWDSAVFKEYLERLALPERKNIADFSRGMKMKLQIAVALSHNAKLLVLDEATSALDSESERLVQQALENLMENRTAIVVAHRLSTVASLDRIIVIKDGKVAEDGTHRELIERDGEYAKLWDRQTGAFLQ